MTPREWVFALEHFGIKLGLDNIHRILDALDRPHNTWQSVHVAGTNGKGSVTAMVERGLRAAGHRTGRYTSPHLSRIEERIAVDGVPIDPAEFDRAAGEVLAVVDRLRTAGALPTWPTFFEVTTAMAFEIFRRSGVEVAVVEVGLGGRFDATNVLIPAVTAITSIALDHERYLGATLAEIAFEKAGIIKPATPVVVGTIPDAARGVIVKQANAQQAPLVEAGAELVVSSTLTAGRASVVLRTPVAEYERVTLGLNGAHQVANAAVAARTLEVCRDRGIAASSSDILVALSDVDWPARLEWLRLRSGGLVLIDAAHNPAGAHALADYLRAAQVAPLPIVLAVMQDKDVSGIVRALAPVASVFVATEIVSPRCTRAEDLAARITRDAGAPVVIAVDAAHAVTVALDYSARVAVAGSMYLSGPCRAHLIAAGATSADRPF